MPDRRLISIHPRLAVIFDVLFSFVLVWWLTSVHNYWLVAAWFAVRLIWWAGLVNFVYYPPYISRYKHFISLFLCNIGAVAFLVFSDPSNIWISQLLTIIMSATSFWLIPTRADSLSIMEKPHRRWKFFMSLFGIIGIWLSVSALTIFQIINGQNVVWSILLAGIIVTAISVWEWAEYGEKINNKMIQLAGVMLLILVEIGGIVFLWPIGYFVSSFFLTWVWYITWLLFRFNLSATGIDWSKQKYFLVSNLSLMLIFLVFIVRWK
ncbi:MAG: hypothetical protein WC725_01605 [Patescibacteria group bacterium]|jgi:hypothetical protein